MSRAPPFGGGGGGNIGLVRSNPIILSDAFLFQVQVHTGVVDITCDQAIFSFRSVIHSGRKGETKKQNLIQLFYGTSAAHFFD